MMVGAKGAHMLKIFEKLDKRYVTIGAYVVGTIVVAFAACMLVVYSGGFLAKVWELVSAVVIPAIFGGLVSYLLQPIVRGVFEALGGEAQQGVARKRMWNASVAIAVILAFLAISGIIAVLMLVITRSLAKVNIETLMGLVEGAQGDFNSFVETVHGWLAELGISTEGLGSGATSLFMSVSDAFSTTVFSVIFAVYFLLDGLSVAAYAKRIASALFGHRWDAQATRLIADADRVFSGYIRGQFVDALVVGSLAAIVLTILGVPYGAVLGMLTGVGNLIPYTGAPVGIASTVIVCLAEGDILKLVLGVIGIAVVMFVDGNIINPRLLSNAVEVHPLLVIAALIAGGALGGIAGMLVAVPCAAFLKIQLDRWLEAREAQAGSRTVDRQR